MALDKITTHAADALKRLNQALKDKPKLAALLSAACAEPQALENALYSLYAERTIDVAVGAQLDVIGKIVGQARENSPSDAQYRMRLRARVRANKSSGTAENILSVFAALLNDATIARLEEYPPASILLRVDDYPITDAADVAMLADFLKDSRAAGVGGQLLTSSVDAARTFTLPLSTTLSVGIGPGAYPSSIKVASTAGFPDSGLIVVYAAAGIDVAHLVYQSKTDTTFEGCVTYQSSGAALASGLLVLAPTQPYSFTVGDFENVPYPATIELEDASLFPSSGAFTIATFTNNQQGFSYSGKTGNTLTGLVELSGAGGDYGPPVLVVFYSGLSLTTEVVGGKLSTVSTA